MKKKIYEMNQKLEGLKAEAQALLDENKLEEAKAKMQEVKDLKAAIEIQQELDNGEAEGMKARAKEAVKDTAIAKNANIVRAMLKKVTGGILTEAENALLLPTTSVPNGANGESYILPQDIRTSITKKMRDYSSMREVVGYIPATALTGSFPIENFETLTELVDFTDGTDGTEAADIKFTNVKYSLKEKAAFIKLSNTLLALSDEPLLEYVAEIFAKKATITENKMITAALKNGKTAKAIDGWVGLGSAINTMLDPAALPGTVIVTNQDGFDYLDRQLDETGRPVLQRDISQPTRMLFKGYPIKMYSNSLLPTVENKVPVFFGNLKEGVKAVDLNGMIAFAASNAAGFMSNTTVARLIEFVDAIQCDASDKCYVYGEIDITPAVSTAETGE